MNITMNQQPQNQNPVNPFAGIIVQTSGVEFLPAGAYYADYLTVEPDANDNVKDKLKWRWNVANGKH